MLYLKILGVVVVGMAISLVANELAAPAYMSGPTFATGVGVGVLIGQNMRR